MAVATRPDEARIAKLAALGELHDEWVLANAEQAGFTPRGKKSDYNLHHVDLDADVAALDEFHAAAGELDADVSRARDGRELHRYWTQGAGLGRWVNSPHPFTTLLRFLMRHMPETKARKTAAEWFREVKGFLPSGHPPGFTAPEVDPVTLREQRERERRKAHRRARRSADPDEIERANELKEYWLHGEGAGRWSRWTQLYNHLKKHMAAEMAKRVAAEWFHERYGYWPGADKNRVAHGKPPRGDRIGPG